MAEVDTSIYKNAQPQNPLDQITKLGGALDTVGKIQVGKAVQGAMGADGQIDQNKLAQILKQTPAGAMKAIPTLDALAKLRSAGFGADQAGLETFQKRMAITHHLMSPLASKTNPTKDDVLDIAARALDPALEAHKYGITLPVIQNALKAFKDPRGGWLPPDQIRKKALEIQTQAATTSEILEAHHPRFEGVNQGGQFTLMPSGTKMAPATGSAIPMTLPPTTPVFPEGGGQPQLLGTQPAVPGGGAVVPGGGPAVPGAQIQPKSVKTVPVTQASPNPTLGDNTPRGPGAAQPPGYSEAATASGGAMAAARTRAATFGTETFPLTQALGSLERLGPQGSGPLTDELNTFKSFLQSAGGTWLPGVDPNKIKDFDEAKKYLTQAAGGRAAAFGHGTDQALATALTANPSMKISNLAAVDLTKATLALRRMEQAQILEADRLSVPEAQYSKWASKWATGQDARAYMVDLLDAKQFERLRKSLKPGTPEMERFNSSLRSAIDSGIVVPGRAGQRNAVQ